MPADPEHRSIVALDIERFGWQERTNPVRIRLRATLRRLCRSALKQAGAKADQYTFADTGDGLLVSISADLSKRRLLDPLVPRLARLLEAHNQAKPPTEQLRLRVAVHAGEVLRDPDPTHGETAIFACRLLDADALRASLAATSAPLALIVSETIFDSIVKHHYRRIDPATYQPILIDAKEVRGARAWVHVPGDPDAPLHASVRFARAAAASWVPPRELPADASAFVGRERELAQIHRLLGAAAAPARTAVVAIDGAAGAGKSALAVRAAHQLARSYQGGQLYLDLQGASPELAPLTPATALARLLRSLGVADERIPPRVQDAAARYRSLLADHRMLIVLDNARDTMQIRPLLPGGPGCAVLITSRSLLSDLDVAARVAVDVLPATEAVTLLGRLAGEQRIAAAARAAAEIARHCGHLPLALRIAGARLATRPASAVGAMARRLADEHQRLDELQLRDLAVRASLEVSYQALREGPGDGAGLARAFRLLATVDGPDLTAPAAAALLDVPLPTAETALDRLADEHLLESPSPGRYRFHDLVRLLARDHALAEEPPEARAAACQRVLSSYLATAEAAAQLLRPGHRPDGGGDDRRGRARPFGDRGAALAWLETERDNLFAVVNQAAGGAGRVPLLGLRLAHALFAFFHLHSHLADWERISRSAVETAARHGDRHAEAQGHNALGLIAWRRHRLDEAVASFQRSLDLRRAAGDRDGASNTLNNLGIVYRVQRRYDQAIACFARSLELRRDGGDLLGEGQTLNNLGNLHREQGRLDQAASYQQQSLAICQKLGDRHGEGNALHSLGETYRAQGRYHEAIACFHEDLAICRELGDRHGEGVTLDDLGGTRLAQGQPDEAVGDYRQSLRVHRRVGDPHGAARALLHLGLALRALGQHARAGVCLRAALRCFEQLDSPEAAEARASLEP